MLEYQVYKKLNDADANTDTLYRVENKVRAGFPDFHVRTADGNLSWVEVKVCRGRRVKFERSQLPFFKKFCVRRGLIYVLVVKEQVDQDI